MAVTHEILGVLVVQSVLLGFTRCQATGNGTNTTEVPCLENSHRIVLNTVTSLKEVEIRWNIQVTMAKLVSTPLAVK